MRCAIMEGGHVLSASDFPNSTVPPAINNDHSLRLPLNLLSHCMTPGGAVMAWLSNMRISIIKHVKTVRDRYSIQFLKNKI